MTKTGHITLLLPLPGVLCLESVMSDKMCGCVCVCTDSLQAGFPNRFLCVFCTSLRYFRRIPTHMQLSQNQCLFPFHLLVPLALLSNVFAATAILSIFSSSRLDLCTAILSNTASLRVLRFGAEHCREYCTSKIQAP